MSSDRVYVPASSLTPEQRRMIVKGIHETINRVEQRPANAQTHTYVVINEVLPEDWGSDGNVYLPKTYPTGAHPAMISPASNNCCRTGWFE